MRSRARAVLLVAAVSLTAASALPAQRPASAGITRSAAAPELAAPRLLSPLVTVSSTPTSPWPYVVIGAFVGGVATVAALSWSIDQSGKDCVCSPLTFAPIAAGGAVLGGAAGYVVYRIRR